MTPTGSTSRANSLAALLLVGAVVAAYANSFAGVFVFDDQQSIVDNPTIRSLRDVRAIFSPPPNTTPYARPLLNPSFALNYAVSGLAPWSYHAVNLLIHAGSALALFGILRRTLVAGSVSDPTSTRSRSLLLAPQPTLFAFGIAAAWALHPVQTESVTYIVQRAESLMGLFYLLTIYCFVRWVSDVGRPLADAGRAIPQPASASGRPTTWAILSVAACALGMLTKEVMVTAPLLIFLYDRTFLAGSFADAWRARRRYYVALAGTWAILAALIVSVGGDRGGFDISHFSSWWDYWLTQTLAIVRYLGLALWPHPLNFDYGIIYAESIGSVLVPALAVIALLAFTAWALTRKPVLGFLCAWFVLILAPSSVMPGTIQMIVEHRLYLPLAAPLVALALALWKRAPRAAGRIVIGLACIFGALTVVRNRVYANEEGLWRDVLAQRPENGRAHYNLGHLLFDQGRTAEAIEHYRRALELDPNDGPAHNNLGTAYLKLRRFADAVPEFQRAIARYPRNPTFAYNLGLAFRGQGKIEEALAQFQRAVALEPRFAAAWNTLGVTMGELGFVSDAIEFYHRALDIVPGAFESLNNLGVALIKDGKFADAIPWLERACQAAPQSSEARVNLAIALARSGPGRREDAIARLREALVLDPGNADARAKLDTLLHP